MAPNCRVCMHPNRHEIDMRLVQHHATPGIIAGEFDLAKSTVQRHLKNHVSKTMASLATRVNALETDQLLSQFIGLYERALTNLDQAESMSHDADKAKAVPALIREARATLETITKVSVSMIDDRRSDPVVVHSDLSAEIREALNRRRDTGSRAPDATGGTQDTGTGTGERAPRFTGPLALVAGAPVIEDAEIVSG